MPKKETKFAYAVIYSSNGDFIIANKNNKAYYFTSRLLDPAKQDGWQVIPSGQLISLGGGMACFPGGGMGSHAAEQAARMEFLEETGVNLNGYPISAVASSGWTDGPYTYYGVYFRVAAADLTGIFNQAILSLNNSRWLAGVIQQQNSPIKLPTDVATEANANNMRPYAFDNELNNVEKWNCNNPDVINTINGWTNQAQNWFINIFAQLRTLCQP